MMTRLWRGADTRSATRLHGVARREYGDASAQAGAIGACGWRGQRWLWVRRYDWLESRGYETRRTLMSARRALFAGRTRRRTQCAIVSTSGTSVRLAAGTQSTVDAVAGRRAARVGPRIAPRPMCLVAGIRRYFARRGNVRIVEEVQAVAGVSL